MKVLILNGSPRKEGNCARLIKELVNTFSKEEVETEVLQIGNQPIKGCLACGYCNNHEGCVQNDIVNEVAKKFEASDGLIFVSPVYYGSANGTLISLLDRLFYSSRFDKRMKVGAAFSIARRAGTVATFDELNKYFYLAQMPVASGRYWNVAFGRGQGEVELDLEGLQNARIVARNMAFLMKSIALGKEQFGLPEKETPTPTHFIKNNG